ncbi:hypothetical protein Tco_1319683 [Tanacetum coccineum]
MMLPNALFDAADLFVAAINGVWRWWSVGDVGDLTWVSDPLILLLRLLLFLLKITIYGSGLLILSAYAPSLPSLLSLPLLMACDDSDGLSVPKRVRSKFGLCASWRGKLAEFAAMAAEISKNEEGVRMEADTFLWLPIVDLLSAIDGVLRGPIKFENKPGKMMRDCIIVTAAALIAVVTATSSTGVINNSQINKQPSYTVEEHRRFSNEGMIEKVAGNDSSGFKFQKVPAEPPDWNDEFKDPKLLLVVDIGSAREDLESNESVLQHEWRSFCKVGIHNATQDAEN